jgi:hypothetical protein
MPDGRMRTTDLSASTGSMSLVTCAIVVDGAIAVPRQPSHLLPARGCGDINVDRRSRGGSHGPARGGRGGADTLPIVGGEIPVRLGATV